MKQINDLRAFELKYDTIIKQDSKGFVWEYLGRTYRINTIDLGRYKRSGVDMLKVLEYVSKKEFVNAGAVIKYLTVKYKVKNIKTGDYFMLKKGIKTFKSIDAVKRFYSYYGYDENEYIIEEIE